MTTIVAVKDPKYDVVVMASDSAFYAGGTFLAHGDKFVTCGHCAFGNAGRAIYDDWIKAEPDVLQDNPMPFELRGRLEELFKRHGARSESDQDGLPRWGIEALYVRAPDIFCFDGAMCVTQLQHFGAVGSGADFALGAMQVLCGSSEIEFIHPVEKAEWIARHALRAAMILDPWTAGTYTSKTLKR